MCMYCSILHDRSSNPAGARSQRVQTRRPAWLEVQNRKQGKCRIESKNRSGPSIFSFSRSASDRVSPVAFLGVVMVWCQQVFDMTLLCRNTINASIKNCARIEGRQQCLCPRSLRRLRSFSSDATGSLTLAASELAPFFGQNQKIMLLFILLLLFLTNQVRTTHEFLAGVDETRARPKHGTLITLK